MGGGGYVNKGGEQRKGGEPLRKIFEGGFSVQGGLSIFRGEFQPSMKP